MCLVQMCGRKVENVNELTAENNLKNLFSQNGRPVVLNELS